MRVLWYRANSPLSGVIRWVTRSPYSHVALVVDGVLYEALARGVRRLEGDEAVARMHEAVGMCDLPVDDRDKEQARFFLEQQVDRGYSVVGLLTAFLSTKLGIHVVVALSGEYVCSGLVATALQIAGYLWKLDARLMTPASLDAALGAEDVPWR